MLKARVKISHRCYRRCKKSSISSELRLKDRNSNENGSSTEKDATRKRFKISSINGAVYRTIRPDKAQKMSLIRFINGNKARSRRGGKIKMSRKMTKNDSNKSYITNPGLREDRSGLKKIIEMLVDFELLWDGHPIQNNVTKFSCRSLQQTKVDPYCAVWVRCNTTRVSEKRDRKMCRNELLRWVRPARH